MPSGETQPRLDLGDLGAADGHAMRRRTIKLDHRAVALLSNEGNMGDRHDMAAMDPDEQAGIELRFGLRDRPRTHPLAGAVMHPGIMGVGPEAPTTVATRMTSGLLPPAIEAPRAVAVGMVPTIWVSPEDVLAASLVSPP